MIPNSEGDIDPSDVLLSFVLVCGWGRFNPYHDPRTDTLRSSSVSVRMGRETRNILIGEADYV